MGWPVREPSRTADLPYNHVTRRTTATRTNMNSRRRLTHSNTHRQSIVRKHSFSHVMDCARCVLLIYATSRAFMKITQIFKYQFSKIFKFAFILAHRKANGDRVTCGFIIDMFYNKLTLLLLLLLDHV